MPKTQVKPTLPPDIKSSIVTALQFIEKTGMFANRRQTAWEYALDEMDLADEAFDEEMQVLKDAVGWVDVASYDNG